MKISYNVWEEAIREIHTHIQIIMCLWSQEWKLKDIINFFVDLHQFTVISLRCGLFYYTYTWVPICRPWGYSTKLNPVSEEAVTHHTIQRYLQAVSFIKWNKDIAHNSQFFFYWFTTLSEQWKYSFKFN